MRQDRVATDRPFLAQSAVRRAARHIPAYASIFPLGRLSEHATMRPKSEHARFGFNVDCPKEQLKWRKGRSAFPIAYTRTGVEATKCTWTGYVLRSVTSWARKGDALIKTKCLSVPTGGVRPRGTAAPTTTQICGPGRQPYYFPALNSFSTCTRSLPSVCIFTTPTLAANQRRVLLVPLTDSTRIAGNLPAGTSTSSSLVIV